MRSQKLVQNKVSPAASALVAGILVAFGSGVHAEPAKKAGSPLDTLMSTRLWADVPEAKGFVQETRPPTDALGYQPVTGTDPERPKLRTKAELRALQSELEGATVQNERKAGKKHTP